MPVTAKLSQKFYEKFGDDLTNELVDWLNQVDTTYRSNFRELNELNFARFEAKLEQRAAQLDSKIDRRTAQLEAKLDQRTAELRAEVVGLRAEFQAGFARLEGGLLARIGIAEGRLARLTLMLWIATLATLLVVLKL